MGVAQEKFKFHNSHHTFTGLSIDWSCILMKLIALLTAYCASGGCRIPELPDEDPEIPKCPGPNGQFDPNCPDDPEIRAFAPPGQRVVSVLTQDQLTKS